MSRSHNIWLDSEDSEETTKPPGWLSKLFYLYHAPFMRNAPETLSAPFHLPPLPRDQRAAAKSHIFEEWAEEHKQFERGAKASILAPLWTLYKPYGVITGFLEFFNMCLKFVGPFIMRQIITILSESKDKKSIHWMVVVLALVLFTAQAIDTVMASYKNYLLNIARVDLSAGLYSALYHKIFRLGANPGLNRSQVLNMCSTDVQLVVDLAPNLHGLWVYPLQILLTCGLLLFYIGWMALPGIGLLLILTPLQVHITSLQQKQKKKATELSDDRMKLMQEMISAIKVVKLSSLEEAFDRKVAQVRRRERAALTRREFLDIINGSLMQGVLLIVSVTTIALFSSKSQKSLDAAIVFPLLSLINLLKVPLSSLPDVLTAFSDAMLLVGRLDLFLKLDERESIEVREDQKRRYGNRMVMKKASFGWPPLTSKRARAVVPTPCLFNIDFDIEQGQCIAIVGDSGSGKTSLLQAILGEMRRIEGEVYIPGSIAYAPQIAWVATGTLQFNITFDDIPPNLNGSLPLDDVVKSSALIPDIQKLPDGLHTFVGQKGANLSGGQAQRVGLARSVYMNGDVYLLDDTLSAVDAQVQQHIWYKTIRGLLQGKTIFICTHQVQYAQLADYVIFMDRGSIAWQGKAEDFQKDHPIETERLRSRSLRKTLKTVADLELDKTPLEDRSSSPTMQEREHYHTTTKEEVKSGVISLDTYLAYFKSSSIFFVWFAIFAVGSVVILMGTQGWVALWSSSSEPESKWWLFGFLMLGAVTVILMLVRGICVATGSHYAAKQLHERMYVKVSRAPMAFFDVTPIGRLLARFSNDIQAIDITICSNVNAWVTLTLQVSAYLIGLAIMYPPILFVMIPLLVLDGYLINNYRHISGVARRIASVQMSPMLQQLEETMAGKVCITTYQMTEQYIKSYFKALDDLNRALWCVYITNRYSTVRFELVSAILLLFVTLSAAVNTVNPAYVGLSLTLAFGLMGQTYGVIRNFTLLEIQMNSVERILEYATKIPVEAPAVIEGSRPGFDWMGEPVKVEFQNVSASYRPSLPPALKSVSFEILGGERVGVVGRSGSGKSSMIQVLFRLIQITEGRVIINGIDIETIGTRDLRSHLSVIPQEPTLFSGTIRQNLDPLGTHSDYEIFLAIDQAHMREAIEALPNRLEYELTDGGSQFSVGERQLLCLARAILKESRILVLDECTASVDPGKDQLIQQTITDVFRDYTVINVAHRLDTIINYDRILAFESGELMEFDTPANLLATPSGYFYNLAKSSGQFQKLYDMIHGSVGEG